MQPRPWGRQVFLVWHMYAYPSFSPFCIVVPPFPNLLFLIFAGDAHDEGFNGPLHVPGDGGGSFEREGGDHRDKVV